MEKLLSYMDAYAARLVAFTDNLDGLDPLLRRLEQSHSQGAETFANSDLQTEPADAVVRVSGDHRTGPHKLLSLWPRVNSLLDRADVKYDESHVIEAEDRGVLRVHTRGEGIDEYDGTRPGGPASPARSEESSGESNRRDARTPPDDFWGTGFRQTHMSDTKRFASYGCGGSESDGTLDVDSKTIDELYENYMAHFHIMHPILDSQSLKATIDLFKKRYCTARQKMRVGFSAKLVDSDSSRVIKKQRSNGTNDTVCGHEEDISQRSSGNALVYLVLALGKICSHRDALPAVVTDGKLNAHTGIAHSLTGGRGGSSSSPLTTSSAMVKPSPISPNVTQAAQFTPQTGGIGHYHSRSTRTSIGGGDSNTGRRNLDVIPGLAYYAKAVEIVSDCCDSNDLVQVQVFLLEGLYTGQLARVKESISWITVSGRAVLNLLERHKLYNKTHWSSSDDVETVRKRYEQGQKKIKDKRANMIVLASWTVLQLESDILAELPLQSSGIRDVEQKLLLPNMVPENETYDGLDTSENRDEYNKILLYYSAQIYLRSKLNEVHQELYGEACLGWLLDQVREMLVSHEQILGLWRDALPNALKWTDRDLLAQDILNARLRAKYWGARYIVTRPFLAYALHIMPHTRGGKSVRDVARDAKNNKRDEADLRLFEAIAGMSNSYVWQACARCVNAAMESTQAFDGVPDRLILTNITVPLTRKSIHASMSPQI